MGNTTITIQGKHGNKKFEFQISPQASVNDLCNEIERETELPVHFQRVIHNGRALNNTTDDMQKELKSLGLKSPVKILVVGKKPDEEDESYKMMKKWESSCDSSAQTLNALQHDIEDMEKGYAPKQLLDENLPKMEKKINIIAEELMKVLISLDGLSFTETQKDARAKRKCLVDRIHSLHRTCDHLSASVQQLLLEHKKS